MSEHAGLLPMAKGVRGLAASRRAAALGLMEAIAVLLLGVLFLTWLASVRERSLSSSADLPCVSLGRGGALCSAADRDASAATSSQDDCLSLGRGGRVCSFGVKPTP